MSGLSFGNVFRQGNLASFLARNRARRNRPMSRRRQSMRIVRRRFGGRRRRRGGFVRNGGLIRFTQRVPGTLSQEKKFTENQVDDVTILTTGSVILNTLNLVNQGDGVLDMLGKKLIVVSISIQGTIHLPSQSDATLSNIIASDTVKIYLILNKQTNGTAATANDFWEGDTIRSHREIDKTQQLQTLRRLVLTVSTPTVILDTTFKTLRTSIPFSIYMTAKIPIDYTGTTGRSITNIRTNNLELLAISEEGKATISVISRIRFTDA